MNFETKNTCLEIKTPIQKGPWCWFMATFVAMFYSQHSRKILLEASENWNKSDKLFKILYDILHHNIFDVNTFENIMRLLYEKDNKRFMYKPHDLIENVPIENVPIRSEYYIGELYNLLNINYIMFEYKCTTENILVEDTLVYSLLNQEYKKDIMMTFKTAKSGSIIPELQLTEESEIKPIPRKPGHPLYRPPPESKKESSQISKISGVLSRVLSRMKMRSNPKESNSQKESNYEDNPMFNKTPPPILIIHINELITLNEYLEDALLEEPLNNIVKDVNIIKNITSHNKTIFYRGVEYELDSVILRNWARHRTLEVNHIIAGITCKGNKYIYNGWIKRGMHQEKAHEEACSLMPFDWNIKDNVNFCLNNVTCIPDTKKNIESMDFCFNFNSGTRNLIYVRKEKLTDDDIPPYDDQPYDDQPYDDIPPYDIV
jgi:hypothetical protein